MDEEVSSRSALFEHYPVTADSEVVKAFNNQINADGKSWSAHKKLGHELKWVLREVTIGKNKETRMYVWWHDASGKPVDPYPLKFPAVDIISPAGPIEAWYVTPRSVLQYGNVENANQRVVFGPGDYPEWNAFCADMDKVMNMDRCRFLADNYDKTTLLSDALKKYGKKHGPDKLFDKLYESLEDSTSHAQFRFAHMKPKHKIFKNRFSDGEMLRVCPKDEKILADPNFDPSNQIRNHLENPPTDKKGQIPYLALNLLEIMLPGASSEGNKVLPSELNLLNSGAVGSMKLTVYGLHSRDYCCSVTHTNSGVMLLTNGPSSSNAMPSVDMMGMLRAAKRSRSESQSN